MESFSALAGHNKRVFVTVAGLIPDLNLLIIIQITLSPKEKNYFGHANNHLQDWTKMEKNTDIISLFAYR